jgi:hypothetical protein|tara:strand:- start:160 stop:420 length:261 start_codon:yes stop_codon:yes gene_type:complete
MSDPLTNFHNTMAGLLELEEDLSPIVKIVVLLRVLTQYGMECLGAASLVHIVNGVMTAELSEDEDDATMHYKKLFNEIGEKNPSIH